MNDEATAPAHVCDKEVIIDRLTQKAEIVTEDIGFIRKDQTRMFGLIEGKEGVFSDIAVNTASLSRLWWFVSISVTLIGLPVFGFAFYIIKTWLAKVV
jgi:hypothetical protein